MTAFYKYHKKVGLRLGLILIITALMFLPRVNAQNIPESKMPVVQIIVNESSQVETSEIRLGDIAFITAGDFLKKELAMLDMGSAPKPGKIKIFDQKRIISKIRAKHLVPGNARISAPTRVYIKRASQAVDKQVLKKRMDQYLEQKLVNKEYRVFAFDVRGLEPYPSGDVNLVFENGNIYDENGKICIYVDVIINGKKEDRITLLGKIEVFERVVCTSKPLRRGDKITLDDIIFLQKNIIGLKGNYATSVQNAADKITTTSVGTNEIIKTSILKAAPLIKKGDVVTLVAQKDKLSIMTKGICLEDGYRDKLIRVENIRSGRMIRGRVKEKSRVEIYY